jgi:hypothetical protein
MKVSNMSKKVIHYIAVALSVSTLNAADELGAKKPSHYKFSRPLPLSLGFVPSLMTNQSVSEFHTALEKNTGLVFDAGHAWLQPQTKWGRIAYKHLLFPAVMAPFNKAIRMSLDVYGKASRIEALGWKAEYVGNTYESYAENYWSMFAKNIWKSYKGMVGTVETIDAIPSNKNETLDKYSNRFIANPKPVVDATDLREAIKTVRKDESVDANKVVLNDAIAKQRSELDAHLTPQGKVLTRTAGYNSAMMHSRDIEDSLWYECGGHLAQLSNHSMGKLAIAIDGIKLAFMHNHSACPHSDLGHISMAYGEMGIDIGSKMIPVYSALAFLGSAEFWGRFFEEADYTSSGDVYVKAPEVGGFRLPNLGFYFTTKGLSYQLSAGYRWGQDLFFPVAIEYVFKGPKAIVECTLGVRKQFAWMGAYVHGEVVANFQESGYGGKLAVGLKPCQSFYADVGLRIDHIDTLEGERNIRVITSDDKWSASVFASVGVLF